MSQGFTSQLPVPLPVAQGGTGVTTSTGTGSVVLNTAPTLSQITFSTTSGIIGTTTNNNAAAGSVGEFISSFKDSSNLTTLTTATVTNITSISLTAGDWDLWANANFTNTGTASVFSSAISTVSATLPSTHLITEATSATFSFTGVFSIPCPCQRLSLSSTTTVYLVVYAGFNTGTVKGFGGIYARRAR